MRLLGPLPRRPSILVLLVCSAILALQGWIEWTARVAQVGETKAAMVNLATSLAQDAEDTIEVADTAIASVVTRLEDGDVPTARLDRIERELTTQAAGWTRFRAIIVMGPDGNWLASSLPTRPFGGFDQDYFQHHRNDPSREAFVGPPIKNPVDGMWSITVSRRFQSANGGFGGVVAAVVNLSYFTDHFATFDLGRNGSITLFAADGTFLARFPSREQNIGRDFSRGAIFAKLSEQASGSVLNTARTDGVRRFLGYRRSSRYPFVLVAGMAEDQALAEWRIEMRTNMLVATALVATIGLLGLYLVRQMLRSQQAEERVRESELRYRQQAETLKEVNERVLLAAESGAIALWEWDITANRMIWDRWMHRLYNMQPAEHPDYAFWLRHLQPDDRAAAEQLVRDALAGIKPYDSEFRITWQDGSIHHIRSTGQVTRDAAGKAIRIVGASWDISEQRVNEEQRAIIIEAAPNGMMIVDEGGIISLANSGAERLFDYPRGSLVGQPVEILVPEAFHAAHIALRDAFNGASSDRGMTAGREFTGRKRDGALVTVEVTLSPVRTPRGRITVVALIDVTERRRQAHEWLETEKRANLAAEEANASISRLSRHLVEARDRAEHASRAKSRFLAGTNHELRTPLNGILGCAQLLRLDGDLTPSQIARVDAMVEAGKNLLQLITRVLDLSEIEAEHMTVHAVACDVRPVLEECLDLIRPEVEAKGLTLSLTLAPDLPRKLIVDPIRLRQVLLNLQGNAARFTSVGTIALRMRPVADSALVRIEVADTGPGIPPEQRVRLFQDFDGPNTEATRAAEGAGLGLALCARLVRLMGGRLEHEDNPGGGSVFWLEFPSGDATASDAEAAPEIEHSGTEHPGAERPVIERPVIERPVIERPVIERPGIEPPRLESSAIQRPEQQREAAQSVPLPARALHVLVVDDVLMNRNIASSFLRAAGHTVTCAENGIEAVEAAASTLFDVILMDVRMPRMNGLEATRKIRTLPKPHGQVPIVALTAQAFTDQIEECRNAGMDSHLGKPFDINTLLAAVDQAVTACKPADRTPAPASPRARKAAPAAGYQKLPILDPVAFERTAGFFTPDIIAFYIRTISELGETLLHLLQQPNALLQSNDALTEAAHTLAGTAGLFGFARLSATGRDFERAVQTGAAEVPFLAVELRATVEATFQEMAGLATGRLAERQEERPGAAGHAVRIADPKG